MGALCQPRPLPLSAALLVLVAALLHASWNLLAKRAKDPFAFLWISMALALVWLGPLAAFRHPESLQLAIVHDAGRGVSRR